MSGSEEESRVARSQAPSETASQAPPASSGSLAVDIRSIRATSQYQGPLPHPALLEGYEKVLPGAAERIFSNWEREATHRRKAEFHVLRREMWGQIFGFVLALVFLGASVWLVHNEHAASGIALIFAEIVALAGVFVLGHRRSKHPDHPKSTDNKEN